MESQYYWFHVAISSTAGEHGDWLIEAEEEEEGEVEKEASRQVWMGEAAEDWSLGRGD